MDNAQKAIMIGVGLFITIIIISVVLLITNLGTGMVDDARDNLGNMSTSLQNTLKSSYDNKTVTGADVQSLYTQYKDNTNFVLVIEAKDGKVYSKEVIGLGSASYGTNYYKKIAVDAEATGGTLAKTNAFEAGFTNSINVSDRYKTYLIKDASNEDNIIGVYCDKQI